MADSLLESGTSENYTSKCGERLFSILLNLNQFSGRFLNHDTLGFLNSLGPEIIVNSQFIKY